MSYYIADIVISLISMLMLIFLTHNNRMLLKNVNVGISTTAFFIMLASSFECIGVLLNSAPPKFRILHIIIKLMEFSVTPFIPIVFSFVFYSDNKKYKALAFPIIHFLFEIVCLPFGAVIYVDENNIYHHGNLYALYYISICVTTAYLVKSVVYYGRKFQIRNKSPLIFIVFLAFMGTVCQLIFSELRIVWLTVSVCMLLFYMYYCNMSLGIDFVTGLLNRKTYEHTVEKQEKHCFVLLFDVNDFKSINDTYGHQQGDEVLNIIGSVIKNVYARYGLCFRIGGDEFCALLDKKIYEIDVDKLNENFANQVKLIKQYDKRMPSVAVGYSEYIPDYMDFREVLINADKNMYVDKVQQKI